MTKKSVLVRLGDWSYRRRWRVVLGWVAVLFVTGALASAFGADFRMEFEVPGAESQRAADLLTDRFPARSGEDIDVVFRASPSVDDPAVRADVEALLADFADEPHVIAVVSPYDTSGPRPVSPDGTIAFATVRTDVSVTDFPRSEAQQFIAKAEGASRPGLSIALGGFIIQNAQEQSFGSEGIGLAFAAFILLLTFGSLLAMGLPLLIALLGLGTGAGLITLLANVAEVPEFATSLAAMIGLGVGIDYVLFIVTRYRSGLNDGRSPREAVVTAMATAGRAVLFAGTTVVISLLGLFVIGLSFLRGLALAASSTVLVIMAASVTLLPALLGFVGHTIDRLHVPFVSRGDPDHTQGFWYRWSRIVQRRPWISAIAGSAVLLALVLPAFSLHFGFPDAGTDPKSTSTRQAYDMLSEGFGPGFNGRVLLAVEIGDASAAPAQLAALQSTLATTPGVQAVTPPVTNPDGDVAVLTLIPTSPPQSTATERLVDHLRHDVIPAAVDNTALTVSVGGTTAATVDVSEYLIDRLPWFIGAVLLLSFLLLMTVFRSIFVPLKAAVMNLLSIGAAYGVMGVLVQGGWLGQLLGVEEPIPIPAFVPMMTFAILFGLSMDYEVFLLSRVREEYVRTGDNNAAVADGLAHTARVITAAAAIMVAVFLAFVLGDVVFVKIIGVGLATAILVDATVVRMVLVPSTMELLGRWNWWVPRWLDRVLPHLHVEAGASLDDELDALLHRDEATPVS